MTDIATLRIIIDSANAQGQASRITADIQRMGDAGTRAERAMGGLSGALRGMGQMAALAAAAVGGIGLTRVITESSQYERALSSLRAVSQATNTEMSQFAETARELGATSPYSATESVQAMEALSSAGLKTTDVLTTIKPALSLASAGQLELAAAAELGATTLNQFNLGASEFQRVADVLATGAAVGATNVSELGVGLRQVGVIASQSGIDLESTTAALVALSDAGLRGEQGGTALRGVLSGLSKDSGEAAEVMTRLGITGSTVAERFEQLKESNISADDALTLFGEEARAAGNILGTTGDKVAEVTDKLRNAEGAVDEMAATIEDNLIGDLRQLTSALSEAALQAGSDSGLNGQLRILTQSMTEFVSEVNEMPKAALLQETKRYWDELFDVASLNGFREALSAFVDEAKSSIPEAFANLPETLARLTIEVEHQFNLMAVAIIEAWAKSKAAAQNAFNLMSELASWAGAQIKNAMLSALAAVVDGYASTLNSLGNLVGNANENLLGAIGLDSAVVAGAADGLRDMAGGAREAAGEIRGLITDKRSLSEIVGQSIGKYNEESAAIEGVFQSNRDLANSERALALTKTDQIVKTHEARQAEIIRLDALEKLDKKLNDYGQSTGSLSQITNTYFDSIESAIRAEEKGNITTADRIRIVDSYSRELEKLTSGIGETDKETKKLERSTDDVNRSTKEYTGSTERLSQQSSNLAREQQSLNREYEQTEDAINRLRGEIDPLWRATEDYLDTVELLNDAVDKGIITQSEAADMSAHFAGELDQLAASAEETGKTNEKAADDAFNAWEFAARGIDELFSDIFRNLIEGTQSWGDLLKNWFVGLLSDLAALAVRNVIVIPFVQEVFGGGVAGQLYGQAAGQVAGQAAGGQTTGGFISNIGSFFSGNSISTSIGESQIGQSIGLEGASLSNAALLGYGVAGGYLGGALFEGEYASTGGGFGASAGALYGSAFGPIGTAVGAALGAVAGGFIGSLFGGDYQAYPYSLVQVGGGGLPIGDSDNISQGPLTIGASGLQFQAVAKHEDLAGAQALQDELLALDAILFSVAPNANLAGVNLGDFGQTLDGVLAGLDGYQAPDTDIVGEFVRAWLEAAENVNEHARSLVLSMDGSGHELAAAFVGINALLEYSASSPMAAYEEALRAQEVTLWDAAAAQRDYIVELASTFEGTPEQIAQLADAVSIRYQQEIALVTQIMGMIQSVQDLGDASIERIRLATMTQEEQVQYFLLQAEQIRASLTDLSDPEQIFEAFQEGVDAQTSAFNALSAENQGMFAAQFINWIEAFQAETQALLADRAAQVESENQSLSAVISNAFESPAATMASAAFEFRAAAQELRAALEAGVPIQVVTVETPAAQQSSQVGF